MRAFLQQAHLCNRPIRDHATGTTPKIELVANVARLGQAASGDQLQLVVASLEQDVLTRRGLGKRRLHVEAISQTA